MTHPARAAAAAVILVLLTCATAEEHPQRVWIPETRVTGVEIETDPTLTVILEREMPTPGWTFDIDTMTIEPGRITAKLTENAPTGMVAQVITPTKIKIPIDQLQPGPYFLELWTRRDKTKPHQPAYATVIISR